MMANDEVPRAVAKEILARAAELDMDAGDSLSVGDLFAAGREVGISPQSLQRAIDERVGVAAADAAQQDDRSGHVAVSVGVGASWGIYATVAASLGNPIAGLVVGLGGVLMSTGVAAGLFRPRREHRRYQLSNLCMWAAYTGVRVLSGGVATWALAMEALPLWALSAAVGALVVGTRNAVDTAKSGSSRHGILQARLRSAAARGHKAMVAIWDHLNTPLWRSKRTAGSHAG